MERPDSSELTHQMRRVLHLVAAGCSTKQIAFRLDISEPTVKWHVSRLFAAFAVPNRAALVRAAAAQHKLRRVPTVQR